MADDVIPEYDINAAYPNRVVVGSFGGWGDKGQEYRPDKCEHGPDEGCMWCCQRCNLDRHWCPGCGTVSDHKNSPCDECVKERQ